MNPRQPDTDEQVFFYEKDSDFYVLSNFAYTVVTWSAYPFPTVEHVYQYERFRFSVGEQWRSYGVEDTIRAALSPHEAFKIAQMHKHLQRADWDVVKINVMRSILRAKVAQHEYVRRKLLATGDRELIENSWHDDFWGWGPNGDGKNILGALWMEIRTELRTHAQNP